MVKVTLEFPNAEAAIVALGKIMGAPTVVPVVKADQGSKDGSTPAPEAAPAKPGRRGRSDKGQPRAPYGPRNQEANAEGPKLDTAGNAPAPSAAPSAEAPQSPAPDGLTAKPAAPAVQDTTSASAPVAGDQPTAEEAQKALEKVFEKCQLTGAQALLAEFNVARLRDLPAEKRAEFIAAAKKKVA